MESNKLTIMDRRFSITFLLILPFILFLFILFAGNTDNADIPNYIIRYQNIQQLGPHYFDNFVDIGFNYFMYAFILLGINFQGFYAFLAVLIFYLLLSVCREYKVNDIIFWLFFVLTVYFLEIVIVRQFLASALFLYSLKFIDNESGKKSNLKFIALNLLALSVHVIAMLNFVYFIVNRFSLKIIAWTSSIVSIIGFFTFRPILAMIALRLGPKYLVYINSISGASTAFVKIIFAVISCVLCLAMFYLMKSDKQIFSKRHLFISELTTKTAFINLMLLPAMRMHISFERLLLSNFLLYILLGGIYFSHKKVTYVKIAMFFVWIVYCAIVFRIFVFSDLPGTAIPVFENNIFWN